MVKAKLVKKPRRARGAPVESVIDELRRLYPDAECALVHETPLQLLVATILSAQCTDARVNMVTPSLFRRFPDARSLAGAAPGQLEEAIRTTGFFNAKAKSIRGAARILSDRFQGEVPRTMEELLTLPGVGRKTANVVLGNCWNTPDGVVVDTHIGRLSRRLGWTRHTDPEKVEQDLNAMVPRELWTWIAHALILHGRRVCMARRPACPRCVLQDICPKVGVVSEKAVRAGRRRLGGGDLRGAGGTAK